MPRGWAGLLACGSLYSPRLPIPLCGIVARADFITAYSCGAAVDSPLSLGDTPLSTRPAPLGIWVGRYPESVVPVKERFQLHAVREKSTNAGEQVVALEGLRDVIIRPVQTTGFLCMVLPRVHLSHHDHWH